MGTGSWESREEEIDSPHEMMLTRPSRGLDQGKWMGWNAMCAAGRTESIWDGSVLEVWRWAREKVTAEERPNAWALRLVPFLTPTRLGGRGARGGGEMVSSVWRMLIVQFP